MALQLLVRSTGRPRPAPSAGRPRSRGSEGRGWSELGSQEAGSAVTVGREARGVMCGCARRCAEVSRRHGRRAVAKLLLHWPSSLVWHGACVARVLDGGG